MLIYTWWHVLASTDPLNSPSAASFEATAGDWLDQISLDKTRVENYKRGRVGLCLVVIGIYLLLLGSRLLIPETLDAKPEDNAYKEMSITTPTDPFSVEADKEEEEQENEFWDPRVWKRANFLLTTLCFMAPMLVFWEFSYSPSFTNNIYGYLVLFKILRAMIELVLEHFLHEKLLVMPFAVVLSASETFAKLCNVCVAARQQAIGNQANKLVAGMRKIRADEFSSDEGSDEDGGEVPFAPIVVARGAIEGRVLTKWLLAARKRLGGAFPRPEAQEEMERYARKLKRSRRRAGKKDHVDSDEEGKDPSRHWRLELNEAARALALRWLWEARDLRDAAARSVAAELREKLQALNDQVVEADDWFFGRELREAGIALRDDGAQLAEEQARVDEDLAQKIRATERDVEAFVEEKRSTNAAEEKAFAELIAKEREDIKARVAARELELLEAYKQKETEFAAAQRQARETGELVPALVAEHRSYLAKMAEDRRTELEAMEEAASTKTQQKEDAFARKLALAEAAVASRRALAQHRILALRKEARGVVRDRESAWQSKARSWIDRASRKVQVKQQEDAEAQLNDKRRRKRVLLAT
ncbi:hypothetical protein AM588_10002417 [Phytophthora nicotianae]|uniref:Transmembrane protein n=1 Tax=Phytophthora nicotianae TaxID=4792 RepID=A0A0W8D092_PHYNI|nr:hypothetical protein AM588_10002417 [Phytophthora nicotianae]